MSCRPHWSTRDTPPPSPCPTPPVPLPPLMPWVGVPWPCSPPCQVRPVAPVLPSLLAPECQHPASSVDDIGTAGHAPPSRSFLPGCWAPRACLGRVGGRSGRAVSRLRQSLSLPAGAEGPEKHGIKSGLNSSPGHGWGLLLGLLLLPPLVLAGIF